MEVIREDVGKITLLNKIVNDLNILVSDNEITKVESFGILRRVNKLLSNITGEVIPVDKIEDDSIVVNSQFKDIVESINYNYVYYAAEIDLLNSMAKVIEAYIDGEIDKAKNAVNESSEILNILKTYLLAKTSNPFAINVIDDDIIGSQFGKEDEYIIAKKASSKNINITSLNVDTNGLVGNLLELESTVPTYDPLDDYEVKFIDERNVYSNKARLKDNNDSTIFELEAYKVKEEIENTLILLDIKKRVLGDNTNNYESIVWNKAPDNNVLTATVTIGTSSYFNTIQINPNLINSFQKVRSLSVSTNGRDWITVVENVFLVPDINAFDENYSEYRGNGIFYIPIGGVQFAKIIFEQDTPYETKIAHIHYHKENDPNPYYGEQWVVTNDDKQDHFRSETIRRTIINSNGTTSIEELGKDAMAIEAKRWSISLKNIYTKLSKYERESFLETKTYRLKGKLLSVSISSNEIIPVGTSVKYELSHDEGLTWTMINPVHRSKGQEIISFSNNQTYIDNTAVKHIEVDTLPTSVKLRITINTDKNNTPTIKNIIINPVLSLEE